ncbi:MAG: hypothetical protein IJF26_02940 [Clostridia bacterium]|nr:hypothetical protein [Clostridia bacterium]
MPFLVYLSIFFTLLCLLIIVEYIQTIWKRLLLIIKLKRAGKKYGFKVKFARFPFLSVFFFKGRLDVLVESETEKYAVVILTSRHRSGKYLFYSDRMEIWKKRKVIMHRVSVNRSGNASYGRSMQFNFGVVYKGKIRLRFNDIINKYPLHKGICILNPAPNTVCITYGTTHTEIHDGDRLHTGFKVYGLSAFIRVLSMDHDMYDVGGYGI